MNHQQNAVALINALGMNPAKKRGKKRVHSRIVKATIPSTYSGTGRPTLLFDGEQTPTTRKYPYLSSYTPTAGDDVLVALLTNSGCILGKIE